MGKASTKAQNKYIAKAYDRINLTMPKGKKDAVQVHATQNGESVNAFINRAIDEAIERDNAKDNEYCNHLIKEYEATPDKDVSFTLEEVIQEVAE